MVSNKENFKYVKNDSTHSVSWLLQLPQLSFRTAPGSWLPRGFRPWVPVIETRGFRSTAGRFGGQTRWEVSTRWDWHMYRSGVPGAVGPSQGLIFLLFQSGLDLSGFGCVSES